MSLYAQLQQAKSEEDVKDAHISYRQFWAIYHKPPKSEYRDDLLERRDSLIPLDERKFSGAYDTPLHVVDKAYDKLTETLGKDWQKDYFVWDMCCSVGNLEVKHSNPRNIYIRPLVFTRGFLH